MEMIMVEYDPPSPEYLINQTQYILPPSPPRDLPWNTPQPLDSSATEVRSILTDMLLRACIKLMTQLDSIRLLMRSMKSIRYRSIILYFRSKILATDSDISPHNLSLSDPKYSLLIIQLFEGSIFFKGKKNRKREQSQPTKSTSQFQEKEILLTTNTHNTQQSYPHFIGADFSGDGQYETRKWWIKDANSSVNAPRDAQIDQFMIEKSTSRCLLDQGQPSIAPQSYESGAIDLRNILEKRPLVDQQTQYCNESSNFVDGESYHQGFEMGPKGTSLLRDVEVDGKGKTEIPLEAILKLRPTGITLVAAAKELGVSRSTLKRRCRDFGISEWRSNKRMRQDQSNQENFKTKSLFICESSQLNLGKPTESGHLNIPIIIGGRKRKNASDSEIVPGSDSTFKRKFAHKNLTLTNTGGREENTELQQTSNNGALRAIQDKTSTVFIVKAKYKEETIKFNFSAMSNFDQLKEEVGSRLNLDSSNFKMTYIDDDGDSVTITRDSDLQLFLNDWELSKTNTMRLFIIERSSHD